MGLRARVLAAILALLGFGCGERSAPEDMGLQVGDILGNPDSAGFARAERVIPFVFPDDHGPHPGFRNEWWYFTGNLRTAGGRRFGYQVTFFRNAMLPAPVATEAEPASAWRTRTLWMAHVALTDVDARRHRAGERFSRGAPGLAGARALPLSVWLEDWRLDAGPEGAHGFPWRLQVQTEGFALDLALSSVAPPVLQGDRGLSQKSTEPGNASYYYSFPRLSTAGTVFVDGRQHRVEGLSWGDREWSTSALGEDQTGWDWFALQFDSGESLMYYQLRRGALGPDPLSRGSWVDAHGTVRVVPAREVELRELAYWQGSDGRDYPVRWSLRWLAEGREWLVEAVLPEQFNALSVRYWEGAVDVRDVASGEPVGQGYLEMTRGRRQR